MIRVAERVGLHVRPDLHTCGERQESDGVLARELATE
jgi:hypothetical protein